MQAFKLPPTPKGHFLIGHALEILRDPFGLVARCGRDHGDVVRLRFGTLTFYLLLNPRDIEYVLRGNHRNFIKDKGTRLLSRLLGQGLLTSEGDFWRRQRRLAQPAFQLDQIQRYSDFMVAYTERLIDRWQSGQTRDIHADMMRLTLEIVGQTLFRADVSGYADRVGRDMDIIMRYFASFFGMIPLLQRLPLPRNFRFRKAVRDLDQIIYDTIGQRRSGQTEGDDLLGRLLAAQDEDGSQMTDQQLHDELVTLFLAGHETTALTLSFCFYLLAQNPAAAARLDAEVQDVLSDRLPTSTDIGRLRYTEWVVRESMRLLPPAPSIGREALSDCEIGGFHVPEGTQIALVQWAVHRDPRWFEDPESFKPERWDNDLAKHLPRGAYFPFGDGPRVCIGNQFAMMEAILILATVVRRFRLSLAPGYTLRLLPSVTLRPRDGLKMTVHQRSSSYPAPAVAVESVVT
jgi:cytochrome P450